MNEFHGWLVVREKSNNDFIDWNNQLSILNDIRKKIDNIYFDNGFIELKQMYQDFHLIASGEAKRKGIEVETVMELFRYVSVISGNSYGLLYTRDEYDERSDGFKVNKMARGIIEEKIDPFLSPCIPMIED